jgi:L-lactate dehydrogenase
MNVKRRKVVVAGAGSVGTTYIYALLHTGLASEIALIDIDEKRVEGEVMDLSHGLPFIPPVAIKHGRYADCTDAHLIVITAGTKQKSGQSRMELTQENAKIVGSICDQIREQDSDAVLVMVTNPVDTLTQLAMTRLGWPRNRVIGSGTVLDTARLKYMLSLHCGIDAHNVHAYVIGEHGDSEVTPWSLAHIAGVPIRSYCEMCRKCDSTSRHAEIAEEVRDSAYHIIDYKGATFYGIGLSLVRISGAVLRNERSVLTVSTMLAGEYNIADVCLSVPCIVGETGVETIIEGDLTSDEHAALKNSADKLRDVYSSVDT